MMRVRLLPATLALTGLLLGSKCLNLALASLPSSWAIRDAVLPIAEAASAAETPHPPTNQPATAPAAAPSPPAPKPSNPPTVAVSDEERQLLQDLRTRRQAWEARDRTLTQREAVLNAAEQRLVARATELAGLQTRLEQLERSRADREDANWTGLVKVYETMKPRDAASIFNDMEMPVLLQITDRMREAKVAPILAAMQPDRARVVTAQLAAKRSRTTTMDHANATVEGTPHT